MIAWLFTALVVFFLQSLLPASFRYLLRPDPQLLSALGPRDARPELGRIGGRAERALANMTEAMLLFTPLALAALILKADAADAAALFVVSRGLYVPAYLSGAPGLRSLIWTAGHAGLLWMALEIAAVAG